MEREEAQSIPMSTNSKMEDLEKLYEVVGHQTDGKRALVEALMGFQFNHVGGGIKTRRPIPIHMKYDPHCELPLCHLVSDSDPTLAAEKSLQNFSLQAREESAIRQAEADGEIIGVGVTSEAQNLFDALSKMYMHEITFSTDDKPKLLSQI